jgi:O-antigen/teichoic acid export membrane protein
MTVAPPLPFINRRAVVTNILALFSGSATAQAMNALALLLIARQIGPAQFGQYTGSTILTMFCAIFFNLGLDLWLLREGGRKPEQIGSLSGSVLAIKSILGLIWLAILFILAPKIETDSMPTDVLRQAAIMTWFTSLFASTLTTFKAILRNKITSILEVSSVIARLAGVLALIVGGGTLALQFIQVQSFILFMSLLVSVVIGHRLLHFQPSWQTAIAALRQSPSYAASDFLVNLFMRQDVLIVALLLGDTAVGLYSPAVGILNAAFLAPGAVHLVIVPVLSNLFSVDTRQAWRTTRRSLGLLLIIGIVMSLVLLFGAPLVGWLLGASFSQSQNILKILSPIIFFHSINFGLAAVLVAGDLQTQRSRVQAIAVIINALLNLLVVRWAGITGVAVVYVITEIVLLIGYTWLALRFYKQIEAEKSLQEGSWA